VGRGEYVPARLMAASMLPTPVDGGCQLSNDSISGNGDKTCITANRTQSERWFCHNGLRYRHTTLQHHAFEQWQRTGSAVQ